MAIRAAALLAAGSGTRFVGGSHKLVAPIDGRAVWEWSLAAMIAAEFEVAVVVTGAVELDVPRGVVARHNPDWALGQASSLRCAVTAAAEAGATSVTVGLADQPAVPSSAWRAVATAASRHRIVIATYQGIRGPHPVRLAREVWPLLPDHGDEGARGLIRAHPDWVREVPCQGSPADIDTLGDLEMAIDRRLVTRLLGRSPDGDYEVVVRADDGEPLVLRNSPLMRDGRPMPTLYWLAGRAAVREVSRLEAAGGVRSAEAEVNPVELVAAHARYAAERDARLPAAYRGPRPSGGVAGTRHGVKCLHAHFAYHLAGGDDPVGRWVAAHLVQVLK
ncbi:MAG: DUF501 domain-containing protein [Actinobacteria bacterium]|nr:DUF501 domain-containing protein [Actinomycetota bacterium]